jgi:membrane-associated protease RseP (regulator of RpoE activity)
MASLRTLSIVVVVIGVVLSGCSRAGGFSEFYDGMSPDAVRADASLESFQGKPQVITGSSIREDARLLEGDGYVQIGASGFNGTAGSEAQARRQGEWLGATKVMYYSEYTGAEAGVMAIPQYTPGQTSYTSSSGSVYGSGGSASYYGSSTTTTPGTYSTSYVPTTYHRYDFHATYWVKKRGWVFGARFDDLSDADRRRLERNTGVIIVSLVKGQPAFLANILVGDIILAVDGQDVVDSASFEAALGRSAGTKITLVVVRGSERKEIAVSLNPRLDTTNATPPKR